MIKKLCFIFAFIFILCGCEVTYDLDLSNGYMEDINVYPSDQNEESNFKSQYNDLEITSFISDDFDPEEGPQSNVPFYAKSISENGGINLSYKFNDRYSESRAVYYCFPSFRFIKGRYIRINTLADTDCFDLYDKLTKITINIKAPFEVSKHNANFTNGNVYTWVIERDNPKAINIEMNNPDYKESENNGSIPSDPDNKQTKNNQSTNNNKFDEEKDFKIVLVLTGLFFVLLFGIIIFRKKLKLQ